MLDMYVGRKEGRDKDNKTNTRLTTVNTIVIRGQHCFERTISWRTPGLCSNALAFASANAAFALALAFDCHVMDAFALAFAFDSNACDWIKCETNANQMTLYHGWRSIMFIFLVGFVWNKPQGDQYKNLLLQCMKVRVHTKTEAKPCVNGFLV